MASAGVRWDLRWSVLRVLPAGEADVLRRELATAPAASRWRAYSSPA